MNYPRQVILQKVREQRKLKSLMILKQSSTLFKKCIYLHKHHQYVKGKHVLCSWHLGQQHGFKHKSFLLKKACTSKATKSSLKDPRTASASLTRARLPKPVELQSLLLQWLHGLLLQKHCISEFFKLFRNHFWNTMYWEAKVRSMQQLNQTMFWGFLFVFFQWVVSRGYFLKPCRD